MDGCKKKIVIPDECEISEQTVSDFLSYVEGSPRTVQTYKYNLRQFFKYMRRNGIEKPNRDDIIEYRNMLAMDHKPATVQGYITALRLFFEWTDFNDIYPNIATHVKTARVRKEHKKDYLTTEQVKMILSTIDRSTVRGRRNYAMFTLMVTAGLRDIEVSRATIGDLSVLGGETILYVQGKGRSEATEYVKIVPEVEAAIRTSIADREGVTDNDPLFASYSRRNMGGHLTTRWVSGIVKGILQNAGFDNSRLTAHSLRHTAVTLALIGGCSLREVRQFARHANIQTTLIYAHALDRADNQCEKTVAGEIFH
jgi:integrase/recombinase XerD